MEPFLFLRLPGESNIRRYGFSRIDGDTLVYGDVRITPWPGTALSDCATVATKSTTAEEYLATIADIVAGLRQRGGKTVIARTICGDTPQISPEAMMENYFAAFPDMLCFMFFHPLTNMWMGASPELLLEVDKKHGRARTRSLAGTRPVSDEGTPWSAKNIHEHEIVTADICRRIKDLDPVLNVHALQRGNLRYGAIEHLCTPIEIEANGTFPVEKIISGIHPTPAICGYPREDAMHDIALHESEPRRCYAGTIVLDTEKTSLAYVILRCVHFNAEHFAIYTGSGITADSDPEDEWKETDAKARPLLKLFSDGVLGPMGQ